MQNILPQKEYPTKSDSDTDRWLSWAREIQALAQTGSHFSTDDYHRNRYARLLEIAAEIFAEHTNLPKRQILEAMRIPQGYATPKVDVRGAVFRGNTILLVQERSDGRWCMPGGWADVGDKPSAMVEREVREESGLIVKAKKIIGVFNANSEGRPLEIFHAYKIVFLCEEIRGTLQSSNETSDVAFFHSDSIPELSEDRTNRKQLHLAFAHQLESARTADFD